MGTLFALGRHGKGLDLGPTVLGLNPAPGPDRDVIVKQLHGLPAPASSPVTEAEMVGNQGQWAALSHESGHVTLGGLLRPGRLARRVAMVVIRTILLLVLTYKGGQI